MAERTTQHQRALDDILWAIEQASNQVHNSQEWEAEGIWRDLIVPSVSSALSALVAATPVSAARDAMALAVLRSTVEQMRAALKECADAWHSAHFGFENGPCLCRAHKIAAKALADIPPTVEE